MSEQARGHFDPHHFKRQPDGSVRVTMRLKPDEAAAIEEAAGATPLLEFIHRSLRQRATYHVRKRRQSERRAKADTDEQEET